MSSDCKTAFVLPPSKGIETITGRTVGNLDRCKEVTGLNKILNGLAKEVDDARKNKADIAAITAILEKRNKILEEYKDLQDTQGAAVELNFDMAIDRNLELFRNFNEGLGVNIVPVPIKNIQLSWQQKPEQNPDMRIAFNQDVPVATANEIGSGSFSASLDLSLYGACRLRDPFSGDLPKRLKVEEIAGLISPTVTYKYEVGAQYTYVARYNRGALAKKIRESSSSGGFFRTSTSSSLIDTAESSGWFSLEMSCDDSRVCEQAKIETAIQIKQRLMQEVLDGIALSRFGYPIAPVDSGSPGKNGASATADALRKCTNPYCQAGAVILDIASSTFGGSSKTDTYIATNNHMSEERVDVSTPVAFTGMISFSK
jgi:hypothetical protein